MMKRILMSILLLAFLSSLATAQELKHQLSSHILDITRGEPATGVEIALSKLDSKGIWQVIDKKETDQNGRIKDFLEMTPGKSHRGIYKLSYYTAPYFKGLGLESFYPFIDVVFELKDDSHYHVPITLSPFGYSTYRGN